MTNWISVEDRLPSKTGRYSVYFQCTPDYLLYNAELKRWLWQNGDVMSEAVAADISDWAFEPEPPKE